MFPNKKTQSLSPSSTSPQIIGNNFSSPSCNSKQNLKAQTSSCRKLKAKPCSSMHRWDLRAPVTSRE